MDGCLRCDKQENKGYCVFRGESKYDIQEIERVHNLIFEGEGLKVCFIDGGLGSGKSYKVNKALKFHGLDEKKSEILQFESFQTGYNDNFIYILFLEILKQDRKKHVNVFFNNLTNIHNILLSLPVSISIAILGYTVLKVFDFSKQTLVEHNLGYIILILLSCIISLFTLPYALTFRKEYTILNRDYYFELVAKLLPKVLIVEDFERLTANQRRQVYEFINYLRKGKEQKIDIGLEKILILGDLKAVEFLELEKFRSMGNSSREAFVTKYYDQKITLSDWINTFEEKYKSDYPKLPLNDAEVKHIVELLKYFAPLISRREYVKFINNAKLSYDQNSFEAELITELEKSKPFELIEHYQHGEAPPKIEISNDYHNLKQLLEFQIPFNKTYYIDKKNPAEYVWENPNLEQLCVELEIFSEIKYMPNLIDAIRINKGFKVKKIEFFESYQLIHEYVKSPLDMLSPKEDYIITTDLNLFVKKNYKLLTENYGEEKLFEVLLDTIVNEKSVLEQMVDDRILENKSDFSLQNYIKSNDKEYENIRVFNRFSDEVFNRKIINLADSFKNFKKYFIFNIINMYEREFDVQEALYAYEVVKSETPQTMYNNLKNGADLDRIIKYLLQYPEAGELKVQKIAFAIWYYDSKPSNEILIKYSDENWYSSVKTIIEQLETVTLESLVKFNRQNKFFTIKFLVEFEMDEFTNEQAIHLYSTVDSFNSAEYIYKEILAQRIIEFTESELCKFVNIIMLNRNIFESKNFMTLLLEYNNVIKRISKKKNKRIISYKKELASTYEIFLLEEFVLSEETKKKIYPCKEGEYEYSTYRGEDIFKWEEKTN